jgi:hypothetical protein
VSAKLGWDWLDFKDGLKNKTILVLLLVITLSFVAFVLVVRIDSFVNVDLYGFGLQFSTNWVNDYWYFAKLLWVFQGGCCILAVLSLWPHSLRIKKSDSFSVWAGVLLPSLAFVYQALSIVFLLGIDNIVYNRLYSFGLDPSYDWGLVYNPIRTPTLALMVVALIALIIPVIRTLKIIKIEIETEE